jgi:hypothetical protein
MASRSIYPGEAAGIFLFYCKATVISFVGTNNPDRYLNETAK